MLGILLALTASMFWAAGAILARLSLLHLRSSTGTIVSLIAGVAVVMSLVLLFFRDYVADLSGTIFLWFVVAGVFQTLLGRFLNYSAVQRIGVSRALPSSAPRPCRHALCRALHRRADDAPAPRGHHGHHRGRGPDRELAMRTTAQKTAIIGYLMAMGAAMGYGGNQVVAKQIVEQTHSLVGAAFSLLFGLVVLSIITARDVAQQERTQSRAYVWAVLAGLASVGALAFPLPGSGAGPASSWPR